jgi:zinc protease
LESLATVTRKDLVDFYAMAFHPKRTRIVVSGDFQKSELVPLLEKAFGKWSPPLKTLPTVAPPEILKKTEVIYVEMPLPQTTFILAMPSVGRNHPDQEILSVFNDILGGSGFDSLLMEEIRSNRGLAYGVSSDLDNAGEAAGMLSIVGQTKAGSTVESIGLAMKILESLRSGPPVRASDLERAKNSTLNSFVFRYVSPFSVALQEATFEMFGFPKDYLANLPGQVEKISASDLSAAATRDIDTSKMLLIVVGFAGRFDRPLESLGLGKPVELPAPNRGFLVTP